MWAGAFTEARDMRVECNQDVSMMCIILQPRRAKAHISALMMDNCEKNVTYWKPRGNSLPIRLIQRAKEQWKSASAWVKFSKKSSLGKDYKRKE